MTALGRLGVVFGRAGVVNLARLKWAAIVLPLIALVVLVALLRSSLHDWLHESPGVFFLVGLFVVCVVAFASVVFALIEGLEARILDQNRRLSDLVERTDRQNAELSALLSVGRASTSSVELADMLDEALAAILDVTRAEAAELWLVDAGSLVLERATGGDGGGPPGPPRRLRFGESLVGKAARSPSAIVLHETADGWGVEVAEVADPGLKALCALPLRLRARTVGVLVVGARERTAFTGADELRVLEGLGEQIALSVENARLHEQVLDRAVLEERERIARELHDGLAQVLGFINTQTQAVNKLLDSDRIDEARSEVEAMGAASREVYADVREAIIGLRGAPKGLVPTLREYLHRLPWMDGRAVELRVNERAEGATLAPSTEIQLVRIVQEALTNARKHSTAARVEVSIDSDGNTIGVQITDDGAGFDPLVVDHTGWPRLGLQTMRERAQAIGGTFEVTAAPGEGTRVSVRVPLAGERGLVGASTNR